MSKSESSKSKKNDDDPDSVDSNEINPDKVIVDNLKHSSNTFSDESAAYLDYSFNLNMSEFLASSESELPSDPSSEEWTSVEESKTKG